MAHHFPEEIILDILLRLPPKSLIRCTSVCKPWNSMIKNLSFIRTHLNRTVDLNNQFSTHLLLMYCTRMVKRSRFHDGKFQKELWEEHYNLHYDNLAFDEYYKLEFPIVPREQLRNKVSNAVCVCNGLVLLANNKNHLVNTFVLCNPSIRKSLTLPKPHLNSMTKRAYFGFGFDTVTNDYKVVRLFTTVDPYWHRKTFYEVYSLAGGLWSDPRSLDLGCDLNYIFKAQAFVNGTIHWEALCRLTNGRSKCFILAFNVGSNSFRRILAPKNFRRSRTTRLSISGDGKSIALSRHYFTNTWEPCLDIWVMKEYGMEESWTKLRILSPPGPQREVYYRPLCFRKSGDVLLVPTDEYGDDNDRCELVCLDLVSKQLKNLGIDGYGYYYAESYVESLLLLDNTDAVSY